MLTNIKNFALIIGAMKCGTTSLFYYLSQHPEICSCREKEPDFFTNDAKWYQGFNWYQSYELWNWKPTVHKIALEASTSYTKFPIKPNAAERISQIEAKFKFLYILRNPIERIESHYSYGLTKPWGRNKDISQVLSQIITVSKYAMQLDSYYQRFPVEDILILNFEDLKRQPIELIKKVCEFLNVDASYKFHDLGKVKNATNELVIENKFLRLVKDNKKIHNLILSAVPLKLRKMVTSPMKKKIQSNFKLSPEQRKFVFNELKEDLIRLKTKYKFDLSKWGIDIAKNEF